MDIGRLCLAWPRAASEQECARGSLRTHAAAQVSQGWISAFGGGLFSGTHFKQLFGRVGNANVMSLLSVRSPFFFFLTPYRSFTGDFHLCQRKDLLRLVYSRRIREEKRGGSALWGMIPMSSIHIGAP